MATPTQATAVPPSLPTNFASELSSVASSDTASAPPSDITSAPSPSATGETESDSTNSPSSSRPPQVHTVKAGAGGFKFEPAELKDVNVGDTVTFEFYPPDHSVARAEFGSACVPYEYTGKDKKGFWSETQWVKSVDELTYFNITIDTAEPIFYYCAAPASCTDQNMVGVINPNSTQTLDKQIISAKEAQFQVAPGEPIPAEGTASLHGGPTGTPAASSHSSGHHSLSGGAIAGIVIGGVAFLAICAALFFYVGRTKSLREVIKDKEGAKSPAPDQGQFPGSPGFAPAPFSPNMGHAEHGGQLPAYGQHNATDSYYRDSHYSAYSPVPQHADMSEAKYGQPEPHAPAELASPTPGQQAFTAELEAPNAHKAPR